MRPAGSRRPCLLCQWGAHPRYAFAGRRYEAGRSAADKAAPMEVVEMPHCIATKSAIREPGPGAVS